MYRFIILLFIPYLLSPMDNKVINYTNTERVYDLLKDGNYLWLATDGGLIKFNIESGTFETFNKANTNSGLMDNHTRVLNIDSKGNLWVGTEYGGLSKYNGTIWQNYRPKNSILPWEYIHSIGVDSFDNIWVGSGESLVILNENDGSVYPTGEPWMAYISLNDILCNKDGTAYIAASWGLGKFENNSLIERYANIDFEITGLLLDKQNNLWLGTHNRGLMKYDGANVIIYDTTNSGIPANVIYDMKIDSLGNIWFTTSHYLVRFDGKEWIIYSYEIEKKGDSILCFEFDKDGSIWLGTWTNGLIKFKDGNFKKYPTRNSALFNNFPLLVVPDNKGTVWITHYQKQDSVISFDGRSWEVHKREDQNFWSSNFNLFYTNDTIQVWTGDGIIVEFYLPENWVGVYNSQNKKKSSHIQLDYSNNLWQVSRKGLWKYDGNSWTLFNKNNTPIAFSKTGFLSFDDQNNLYALSDVGLIIYDGQEWKLLKENYFVSDTNKHRINAMSFDKSGNLWLGTYPTTLDYELEQNEELIKWDGNTIKRYNKSNSSFTGNTIYDLNFDSKDNLWIATQGGGLIKFDCNSEWTVYNSENSGIFSRFELYSLEIDRYDNKWFGVWWGGIAVFNEEGVVFTDIESEQITQIPNSFHLYQNYPNPFNPSTQIKYYLPNDSKVSVKIYDILGNEITVLLNNEFVSKGLHTSVWNGNESNGKQCASGIYLCRLYTDTQIQTIKLLLVR